MVKIGIYIPDERMKDIDRWRKKLNFSRIFMEAFDRAIIAETTLGKIRKTETHRCGFNQGFVDAVKQIWDEVKTAM